MPCPMLFATTAALPALVRGPVDFKAFSGWRRSSWWSLPKADSGPVRQDSSGRKATGYRLAGLQVLSCREHALLDMMCPTICSAVADEEALGSRSARSTPPRGFDDSLRSFGQSYPCFVTPRLSHTLKLSVRVTRKLSVSGTNARMPPSSMLPATRMVSPGLSSQKN